MGICLVNILLFFLFFVNFAWGSTSCELIINQPAYIQSNLGTMTLSSTGSNYIWFNASDGNKTSVFNTNDLYEVTDSVGSRYFRINGKAFNHTGTGQTFLYDLAYGFNVQPPAGTYTVKSYTTERKLIFGRTLDTIGDSITWWQQGRFLRCLMRDSGLMYDFRGTYYDVFGFGHDGSGGDKTQDVINRISAIVPQDAYFVLIGTNDRITPQQTVNNIQTIVLALKEKNSCAKVYFSTLLPRTDEFNARNQEINTLLRALPSLCDGCILIDTGAFFYSLPSWQSYLLDGVHPSYTGYQLMAAYLSAFIK